MPKTTTHNLSHSSPLLGTLGKEVVQARKSSTAFYGHVGNGSESSPGEAMLFFLQEPAPKDSAPVR